jgi:hypothetical protein
VILNVGQKLTGQLEGELSRVQLSGNRIEYLVTTDGSRITVTLVNVALNGSTWTGTLTFALPSGSYAVSE